MDRVNCNRIINTATYKTVVVHCLHPRDPVVWFKFCKWCLKLVGLLFAKEKYIEPIHTRKN
jgi:hypothetical protein